MEWTSDELNEESPYFSSQRLFAVMREGGGRRGGERGKKESLGEREGREVERERERGDQVKRGRKEKR